MNHKLTGKDHLEIRKIRAKGGRTTKDIARLFDCGAAAIERSLKLSDDYVQAIVSREEILSKLVDR